MSEKKPVTLAGSQQPPPPPRASVAGPSSAVEHGPPPSTQATDHDDGLPGYSEPSATFANPSTTTIYRQLLNSTPGLPAIDISQYVVPDATLSKDQTTLNVASQVLCTNPEALTRFISSQAAVPPRPQIRITGVADPNGDRRGIEFDIRLNLMQYLIRPAGQAQWNYMKLVEPGEMAFRGGSNKTIKPHASGGLPDWARLFCKSSSTTKAFVLERQVSNWNTPLIEGRIRTLLASLHYQGRITVSFLVSHTHVVITPSPPPTGVFPKLLSLLTETKRYGVVRAVWPYANMAASSLSTSMEERGGARRACAVQSEEEWWEIWSDAIARAVAERRKGWVTVEDVLESVMCPRR